MNNLNLKKNIEDLLDTFLQAGKIAKEISQRGVKITIKADKSPVTDGDLAVDKALRNKIKNVTPNIPIIGNYIAEYIFFGVIIAGFLGSIVLFAPLATIVFSLFVNKIIKEIVFI